MGGSFHNNHHAFGNSASNQHRFWEFDPSYWFIWTLGKLGLAWDIKLPFHNREKASEES